MEPRCCTSGPPQELSWEYLERKRLRKLGLEKRFLKHSAREREPSFSCTSIDGASHTTKQRATTANSNSVAPFSTKLVKPFCGYSFQWTVTHAKQKLNVPAADVWKWQSIYLLKDTRFPHVATATATTTK